MSIVLLAAAIFILVSATVASPFAPRNDQRPVQANPISTAPSPRSRGPPPRAVNTLSVPPDGEATPAGVTFLSTFDLSHSPRTSNTAVQERVALRLARPINQGDRILE